MLTIATCIRRARSHCQREDHWPTGGGFYRFAVAIPPGGTTVITYNWLVGTSVCEMLNRKRSTVVARGKFGLDSASQLYRPTSGASKRMAQIRRVRKGPLFRKALFGFTKGCCRAIGDERDIGRRRSAGDWPINGTFSDSARQWRLVLQVDGTEAHWCYRFRRFGGGDEWHLVIDKPLRQTDIGKKASLG